MTILSFTKQIQNAKRAFTLIELIVVIAIISLLASIIMANISDSRVKAQNAATIEQVRQYENAMSLYLINNQNRYPNFNDTDMHCVGSGDVPCLWGPAGEIAPEENGPLSGLELYIRDLPFVDTPTLSGVLTYKGLLYQCNDANCRSANFYWPETNTTTCTKGTIHYTGTNGVICTGLAEGGAD